MSLWKKTVRKLRGVWYRIYSDFLMPSRLPLYEELLREALAKGYTIHSVPSFLAHLRENGTGRHGRHLVLRHDIDTDTDTARAMWEVEQRLGVKASYYFRLSTVNIPLMQEIHQSGSEASYHYEEIASLAKKKRFKTKEQVYQEMPTIRKMFSENLASLREQTGLPLDTVAAHGDFFNRKVGIPNHEILNDEQLRQELGILFETYDDEMMIHVTCRHSDTLAPSFWKPEDPFTAIQRGEPVIYVLTHPRHWRTHIRENLNDNIRRLWEEIQYRTSR